MCLAVISSNSKSKNRSQDGQCRLFQSHFARSEHAAHFSTITGTLIDVRLCLLHFWKADASAISAAISEGKNVQGKDEGIENNLEETSGVDLGEGSSGGAVDDTKREYNGRVEESEDQNQAKLHEELPPAVVAIVVTREGYWLLQVYSVTIDIHTCCSLCLLQPSLGGVIMLASMYRAEVKAQPNVESVLDFRHLV